MKTFQVGDKVRRINSPYPPRSIKVGDEHIVAGLVGVTHVKLKDMAHALFDVDNFELVEDVNSCASSVGQRPPTVTVPVMTESEAKKHYAKDGIRVLPLLRELGIVVPDPIDPALLGAREYAASTVTTDRTKQQCLDGVFDKWAVSKAFLAGVEWAKQNKEI